MKKGDYVKNQFLKLSDLCNLKHFPCDPYCRDLTWLWANTEDAGIGTGWVWTLNEEGMGWVCTGYARACTGYALVWHGMGAGMTVYVL